jgi:hypothetical protein
MTVVWVFNQESRRGEAVPPERAPQAVAARPLLSHAAIIREIWPQLIDCARETGIGYEAVKKIVARNSIGRWHFATIIAAARKRGLRQVTFEMLTRTAPKHGAARAAS